MMTIRLIFGAILIGFAMAIIVQAYLDWRNTPADQKDSLGEIIALGKGSLTKSWLRIVGLVGALLSGVSNFAEALQMPQVADAINKYMPAQYVTAAFLVIALIGIWARNRTSDSKSIF